VHDCGAGYHQWPGASLAVIDHGPA
jgi:hypothetical protein